MAMNETRLKVTLITHTPTPDRAVADAAERYLGTSAGGDVQAVINELIQADELAPFEHATFTFAVEGLTRACAHRLTRHRPSSYSERPGKIPGEQEDFGYVIPPRINQDKELREYFVKAMSFSWHLYSTVLGKLQKAGVETEDARADARFVLPGAAATRVVVTMSARELRHFFEVNTSTHARWEIRRLAQRMLEAARVAAPLCFHQYAPAAEKHGQKPHDEKRGPLPTKREEDEKAAEKTLTTTSAKKKRAPRSRSNAKKITSGQTKQAASKVTLAVASGARPQAEVGPPPLKRRRTTSRKKPKTQPEVSQTQPEGPEPQPKPDTPSKKRRTRRRRTKPKGPETQPKESQTQPVVSQAQPVVSQTQTEGPQAATEKKPAAKRRRPSRRRPRRTTPKTGDEK